MACAPCPCRDAGVDSAGMLRPDAADAATAGITGLGTTRLPFLRRPNLAGAPDIGVSVLSTTRRLSTAAALEASDPTAGLPCCLEPLLLCVSSCSSERTLVALADTWGLGERRRGQALCWAESGLLGADAAPAPGRDPG